MSQEEKLLLLIDNYDFVIHEEPATEEIGFHLGDINMDWELEHPPYSRLNYLTEYFREQKNAKADLKYVTLAAHCDVKLRKIFFNVQLNKQVVERLCSALPHPVMVFKFRGPTLDSQSQYFNPDSILHESIFVAHFDLNLRELITAEKGRIKSDFYNKTFEDPFLFVCGIGCNAVEHSTPSKVSDCRGRFSLSVGSKEPVNNIQISTQYAMEKLFRDEETKDLTIVAGNGAVIKCHRIIFSAHCPAFSRMLSPQNPMNEATSGRVDMPKNSEEGVRTLIKYLYGMPMIIEDLSVDVAVELLQIADQYDLSQLEGSLERLFLKMEVGWFTPDAILELYLSVKNLDSLKVAPRRGRSRVATWDSLKELREHCLDLMTSMDMKELRACEEFKKMGSVESTDILVESLQKRASKSEERGVKRKVDSDDRYDSDDED